MVGEVACAVKGTAAPDRINLPECWANGLLINAVLIEILLSEPKSWAGRIYKVATTVSYQEWPYIEPDFNLRSASTTINMTLSNRGGIGTSSSASLKWALPDWKDLYGKKPEANIRRLMIKIVFVKNRETTPKHRAILNNGFPALIHWRYSSNTLQNLTLSMLKKITNSEVELWTWVRKHNMHCGRFKVRTYNVAWVRYPGSTRSRAAVLF